MLISNRRKNVRKKLNAMALEFANKNVLLVDGRSSMTFNQRHRLTDSILDSIVRGTTSKEIVQMAKDVGAKKVIVASCAPPIRSVKYMNFFPITDRHAGTPTSTESTCLRVRNS